MRFAIRLIVLCCLMFNLPAFAILNIELTQGMQGAIPIAVVPFNGQPADMAEPNNVAGVVTHDLQNSGRFKLMSAGQMQQTPANASGVEFSYWQKQNINDMVVGKVTTVGGNRYRVDFQLLNVYGNAASQKSSGPAWQNAVILDKTFTVNSDQLRSLAHHISDLVYQALTGDRGVFSTRIAYVLMQRTGASGAQYVLEVSDMDGYNPKPLLRSNQPIMSPAWSPDGRKLAYVSFESGRPAIYIQDVASGARQMVSDYQGLNSAPAWSPDGTRLALVLTRTGYPKIFIMNVADHSVTQLTQGMSIDTEPNWSPDGKSIIFTSNRGGGPQIYRVSLSNPGSAQRITFNGSYNARPSFVPPKGNQIVVLNGNGNMYNIALQDLSSGNFTVLTHSGKDQSPSVAPNGKILVYATVKNGQGVLAMVSTDDRVKLVLPAREGDVREPAWSPFLN